MPGPNLNLDYDPLEGPSTRIWKPKEELNDPKLDHLKFFMSKFMDNIFTWDASMEATKGVESDKEKSSKEHIPETGSERSRPSEDISDSSTASKITSMKMDREKLDTFRSLARELGCRMSPEQKMACGLLFNLAMKNNFFSSVKVEEEQLGKLQNLAHELGEKMPRSQRIAFGAVCSMAMERFREHAICLGDKEQLPVERIELELD